MLFSRSSILAVSCLVLSTVVNAAPIQSTSTSTFVPEETGFLLTESLSEYYENIVDQVMLDVSESVLSFLPESISHGEVEGNYLLI